MTPPLLTVQNLQVHFPTAAGLARAVDGISFTLAARQTLCVVGESGCGKTATALALLRLLPPSARLSGSVHFEHGMALLLITHNVDVVAAMADQVAVMYAGQIVEQGPAQQIFQQPLHPYTAGL